MRKIRLELNALAVDSFETASARVVEGTVRGHEHEDVAAAGTRLCTMACTMYSCPVQNTEYASCQIVCDCTSLGSPC